jgi:hypothetical protein
MVTKKNRISASIEDCADCKFHCGKVIDGRTFMFCQKDRNCIMLREGIGPNAVPDWCPRLVNIAKQSVKRGMRATTGAIDDALPSSIKRELPQRLADRYSKEAVLKRRCEELQTRIPNGHIMTVDQFIELVEERSIIDDDGSGSFADYAANKHEAVWCDVDWLNEHRGEYPFVIWYGR